jgi:hypothetical protein
MQLEEDVPTIASQTKMEIRNRYDAVLGELGQRLGIFRVREENQVEYPGISWHHVHH